MSELELCDLQTIAHSDWISNIDSNLPTNRLIVTTCGYESRSIYWMERYLPYIENERHDLLVFGFKERSSELSRPHNIEFYKSNGVTTVDISTEDYVGFLSIVTLRLKKVIEDAGAEPVEFHVDYSSMPRSWYCRLPLTLKEVLRPIDKACFWYTCGLYDDGEYPTAGVEDFKVFAGQASLEPKLRTHFFGLGFDRIRSQAIWSVLDPQNLVCFFADPASDSTFVQRVQFDNQDVLAAAQLTFSVPISDFAFCYSKIRSIVVEQRGLGDVIIVPDGPKPLILASSLLPDSLEEVGIVCFHVTRRKSDVPVNVRGVGDPCGFSFRLGDCEKDAVKRHQP